MFVMVRRLAVFALAVVISSVLQGCENKDEATSGLVGFEPNKSTHSDRSLEAQCCLDIKTLEKSHAALQLNALQELQAANSKVQAANARIAQLELDVTRLSLTNTSVVVHKLNVTSLEALASARNTNMAACLTHCQALNVQGRWKFGSYSHLCPDVFTGKTFCKCTNEVDKDTACSTVARRRMLERDVGKHEPLRRAASPSTVDETPATTSDSSVSIPSGSFSVGQESVAVVSKPVKMTSKLILRQREPERSLAVALQEPTTDIAAFGTVDGRRLGSPSETVSDFCNATGLAIMHGHNLHTVGADDPSELNELESSLLADVSSELENNNVDKVARDIFSFYVCVRWVPDPIFWQLAKQELATDLLKWGVDAGGGMDHAIAELYQNYKFVPLLCSRNLEVFSETDDDDNTYFRAFKKKMTILSTWLKNAETDEVSKLLKEVDGVFCGGDNMNDKICQDSIAWSNKLNSWGLSWFSGESSSDKWGFMANLFKKFQANPTNPPANWASAWSDWKAQFPYHSFVHKPEGMPPGSSPLADQRYLVCFGKRVASELHRRPHGQHIMTDQNNVGCHGFWSVSEVKSMMDRIVALWAPPSCQLSEMVFTMKKQMLKMYSELNTRLFDALPSLIEDEALLQSGSLEQASAGPLPFAPVKIDGFVDGMRVKATKKKLDPDGCCEGSAKNLWCKMPMSGDKCSHIVEVGHLGRIKNNMVLGVVWDADSRNTSNYALTASAGELSVVPREWTSSITVEKVVTDAVSGIGAVFDYVGSLFTTLASERYANLASLMSGSTAKWVVCPIDGNTNLTLLDSQLGVEDANMKDHSREAYSKWTGYKAKVPGDECVEPEFLNMSEFPGCKVCEISELHADHLEKYTMEDGTLEPFLCPLKHSLPSSDQLNVFKEKGQCVLKMTENQQQHYQWPYNGNSPARRQYDKKPNNPSSEYELIKLLNIPSSGTATYARTCTPEESAEAPRFCKSAQVMNLWDSMGDFAKLLEDSVQGSLGVYASALTGSMAAYQTYTAHSNNMTASDYAENAATMVKDQVWDTLTGAGRLLTSAGTQAVSALTDGLPGATDRNQRIEDKYFGSDVDSGNLLHTLSFQRPIGTNGKTSNAKERYQRYVMTCPCPDFDPGLEFANSKKWSSLVLWMVKKATGAASGSDVLKGNSASLAIRGEGRLFRRPNTDVTWWAYGAAMKLMGEATAPITCKRNWMSCEPESHCETSGLTSCTLKTQVSNSGWFEISSTPLQNSVTPEVTAGGGQASDIKGYVVSLYCGRKRDFGKEQGSEPNATALLACMQAGVESNAVLRAQSPWKLYFPDEVVVMAVFKNIANPACKVDGAAAAESDKTLCEIPAMGAGAIPNVPGVDLPDLPGATAVSKEATLDAHLSSDAKQSQDGAYQGLRTGSGWPKGSLAEVVMQPQDILQAAGILVHSG